MLTGWIEYGPGKLSYFVQYVHHLVQLENSFVHLIYVFPSLCLFVCGIHINAGGNEEESQVTDTLYVLKVQ